MTFLKDLLYYSMLPVPSILDQVDLADTAHKEQLNSNHENSQELALISRSKMLPVRTGKAILTHCLFRLFTV